MTSTLGGQVPPLLLQKLKPFDSAIRKTVDHRQLPEARIDLIAPLHIRSVLKTLGVVVDLPGDLGHSIFEHGEFGSEPRPGFVGCKVILGLMLGPLQVLANRFEFLERNIDRAVLAARQKERSLAVFKVLLNRGPARGSNS